MWAQNMSQWKDTFAEHAENKGNADTRAVVRMRIGH